MTSPLYCPKCQQPTVSMSTAPGVIADGVVELRPCGHRVDVSIANSSELGRAQIVLKA